MSENRKWHYVGPVYHFDVVHTDRFEAWTTAPTKGRALANIVLRYKLLNGYAKSSKFELEPICLGRGADEHNNEMGKDWSHGEGRRI